MNGHISQEGHLQSQSSARSQTLSSHLGKRKRSSSPTKPVTNDDEARISPDPRIESIVREVKE